MKVCCNLQFRLFFLIICSSYTWTGILWICQKYRTVFEFFRFYSDLSGSNMVWKILYVRNWIFFCFKISVSATSYKQCDIMLCRVQPDDIWEFEMLIDLYSTDSINNLLNGVDLEAVSKIWLPTAISSIWNLSRKYVLLFDIVSCSSYLCFGRRIAQKIYTIRFHFTDLSSLRIVSFHSTLNVRLPTVCFFCPVPWMIIIHSGNV